MSERSDVLGWTRLGIHAALLAGFGWLALTAAPWLAVPAIVLLGIVQSALFAPVHETMHLTAFASRRTNAVIGWITACPSLINWHFYAVFHLAHHRFTQDPARDPELMTPAPVALDTYLPRILGINYWRLRLAVIRDCWRGDLSAYPYIGAPAGRQVIASVRWMTAAVVAAAVGSGLLFGWRVPLVLWILPQLVGQVWLRLYLLTEHTGCLEGPNGLLNTRTTLTMALVRLLMWNMSFHAEHHLYPSIPFHRLPAAHQAVKARLGVIQDGYATWHTAYLRGVLAPKRGVPASS